MTPRPTKFIRNALIACAALTLAGTSPAAIVTWGPATGVSGDSDVSTNGTLVGALNLGDTGVGSTTVNGVTFTGLGLNGNNATSGNFTFSTAGSFISANDVSKSSAPFNVLTASYQLLLSSIGGTLSAPTALVPFALTMSGLTVGESYEFQWWSTDTAIQGFFSTATAGNSVTLDSNPTDLDGGLGQFAIGIFVADAATQTILFSGADLAALNAIQLRSTPANTPSVPDSGTTVLMLGIALSALVGYRRTVRR